MDRLPRKGLFCAGLLSAVLGIGTICAAMPVAAAGLDAYALTGSASFTNATLQGGTYSLNGDTCLEYVDVAAAQSGGCSVLGGGQVTGVGCSTGMITAGWQLSGTDTAGFNGEGVIVGGVAIIAGAPSSATPGLGYSDEGRTGAGVSVGLFLPKPSASTVCGVQSSGDYLLTAALVGEY